MLEFKVNFFWRQHCDKVRWLVSVTVVQCSVYKDPGDQTRVRKGKFLKRS